MHADCFPQLINFEIIKIIWYNFLQCFKVSKYDFNNLEKIGLTCSENERNSESAERELQSILLCNYATKFIGKTFTATEQSAIVTELNNKRNFLLMNLEAYCPVIFDSWTCWNASLPGTVQKQPCPDFPQWGWSPSSKS